MTMKKVNNGRGKTLVTESLFNAVKTLVMGGAKNKEISEYMNLGETAISRIRSAESYAEYKQILAAIAIDQKKRNEQKAKEKEEAQIEMKIDQNAEADKQVVEHRQTVTIQATHYMMEELRIQNDLLKDISRKLAFIVEQLA